MILVKRTGCFAPGCKFNVESRDMFLNFRSMAENSSNSLIGPFQGTSPALLEKRMKKLGRPIGAKLARGLAGQAEQNIRQRLQNGGKKMPPFRHLDGKEVNAAG